MIPKEEIEQNLEKIKLLIDKGEIRDCDINQIAMDRMREYIENYDKVEEIQRRVSGLIQSINKFGSHNRIVLISEILIELNLNIPLEPNARIGILENIKQFIFEDAKRLQ